MRVIFMGTPDFAVGVLESILEAGHEVAAVLTQPDKPKGRGNTVQFPAVKVFALQHGLPVYQPAKVRVPEVVEMLKGIKADIMVVAAFGQILPKEILEMTKYGCINVHASLLPKYRGAAPIQWVIINGEKESGVTIMKMNEGLDTGDMIMKTVVPISQDETGGSYFDKLSSAGARLCIEAMKAIEAGSASYEKQDDGQSSYAHMIHKDLGNIIWSKSAVEIERLIRGLNPWPSAYTYYEDKTLKIWEAVVIEKDMSEHPGEIVELTKDQINIQTGKGILGIRELQLEGKKRMRTDAFLRGYAINPGIVLTRKK